MNIVFLIRTCPYGMASAAEAYRAVIGVAGMGLATKAVFVEDGVYSIVKNQKPETIDMHPIVEAYKQVGEFGAKLYIHKESMEQRGLNSDEIIEAEIIDTEELKKIIEGAKHIVTFT